MPVNILGVPGGLQFCPSQSVQQRKDSERGAIGPRRNHRVEDLLPDKTRGLDIGNQREHPGQPRRQFALTHTTSGRAVCFWLCATVRISSRSTSTSRPNTPREAQKQASSTRLAARVHDETRGRQSESKVVNGVCSQKARAGGMRPGATTAMLPTFSRVQHCQIQGLAAWLKASNRPG